MGEVIFTDKKKKKKKVQAGNESWNVLPKSSHGKKKTPPAMLGVQGIVTVALLCFEKLS